MRTPDVSFSELDGVRYLHFGTHWVQGAMRMRKPYALELTYVQDMMAWLLFLDPPPCITQLGLGAGSLTKYCLKYCDSSQVTVVELSDTVIMAAETWFRLPRDHSRLQLLCKNALDYVRRAPALDQPSVLQVDIYDQKARGPVLDSLEFYTACARLVSATSEHASVSVFNFFGHKQLKGSLERLCEAYYGRVMTLAPCAEGNVVALAFGGPKLAVADELLVKRAKVVERRFKLPVQRWLAALNQPENRLCWQA